MPLNSKKKNLPKGLSPWLDTYFKVSDPKNSEGDSGLLNEIFSFYLQEKTVKVTVDPAQKLRIGVYLACHVPQSQIPWLIGT